VERLVVEGLVVEGSNTNESEKKVPKSKFRVKKDSSDQAALSSIALLALERALTYWGRFTERESLGGLGSQFKSSWPLFVPGQ